MIQGDYRAAIDVGTTKVCVIIATNGPDGQAEMVGIGSAPCDGLRKGTVADIPSLATSIRNAVEAAEKQSGLSIDKMYVGLSGSHIRSESRWTHVPRQPGVHTVTDGDIKLAMEGVARSEPVPGRRVLHVLPGSYTLDGTRGVKNPTGMHAAEMHVQSQVVSGSAEQINALEDAVRMAGYRPASAIVEPMAIAEAVFNPDELEGITALVEIGGSKTDIAVFRDGIVIYAAALPVGGYQFTNDLAIGFSLPYAEAEKLKVEHGTVTPDVSGPGLELLIKPAGMAGALTITQRDVGMVLRDRAEELFEMVRIRLSAPELAGVTVDRMVLTGGGAKLEGIQSLAKHALQIKVRKGVPKGMGGLPEANRDPSHAAVMGLIIWAMRNLPPDNHLARNRQSTRGGHHGHSVLSSLREWLPVWGAREPRPALEKSQAAVAPTK